MEDVDADRRCMNPRCLKVFPTVRGLSMHLAHSDYCRRHLVPSLDVFEDLHGKWIDHDLSDTPVVEYDSSDDSSYGHPTDDQSLSLPILAKSKIPGTAFTNNHRVEVNLLQLIDDINAPHTAYKAIMTWAHDAFSNGYQFEPKSFNRQAQIVRLEKWLGMDLCRPQRVHVRLPGDDFDVPAICCDFVTALHSLLNNPELSGDIQMLDVNPDDPFGKYMLPGNRLMSVNSGQWYERAYECEVKNPRTDMLVPIIFYVDETYVSSNGKLSCLPVMFTTSLFPRSVRNLHYAWRLLGYIYDQSTDNSGAE